MAWSRLVPGYIVSLALSQITRAPGVSPLNPTKKEFSAVSWLRKQKPGPSHPGGIPGARAPVKFSAVRYEASLGAPEPGGCGGWDSRALSVVGHALPVQAAPALSMSHTWKLEHKEGKFYIYASYSIPNTH